MADLGKSAAGMAASLVPGSGALHIIQLVNKQTTNKHKVSIETSRFALCMYGGDYWKTAELQKTKPQQLINSTALFTKVCK